MNKKGQVMFFGFMLGLTIIILALALAPAVVDSVGTARNASNMDCDNSSISYGDQAACIATDSLSFYFIGGLIFIGGLVIGAKILFG